MLSLRALCFGLLLSLTMAAPLQKGDAPSAVNEVEKQEEELQSLLQLADEKSAQPDVTVHEEHRQHVHEINGKKTEVDTSRKTVSDTKTGEVLADVKQEVSVPEQKADAVAPEVEVKTEVDVPEAGVHETFVLSGDEGQDEGPAVPQTAEQAAEQQAEEEEEIEFSPEAVAEYLMKTGDYDRFYLALAQLVNASIMTEEEAQSYSQLVALEFDRLQMEEYENNIMVQRREPQLLERYPMAMDTPYGYYPPSPMDSQEGGYPVAMDTPEELLALEQAEAGVPKEEFELDPYDLLSALWSEAYGAGDVRAQELVGELFNKVRGDNDPDDEAQVRDILLDLIANSVMNEEAQLEQPQYGWQPIVDEEGVENGDDEEEEEEEEELLPPLQPVRQQPFRPAYQAIPQPDDDEAVNELLTETEEKRTAEDPKVAKKEEEEEEEEWWNGKVKKEEPTQQEEEDEEEAQAESSAAKAAPEAAAKSESSSEDKQGEKSSEEKTQQPAAAVAAAPALPSAQKRAKETV